MGLVKGAFAASAIALVALGFFQWRLDLDVPGVSPVYCILGGVLLGAGLFWGRIVAPFVILISVIPIAWVLFWLAINKAETWASLGGTTAAMITGGGIIAGILLYLLGSETIEENFRERAAAAARPVICVLCGQYLGRAGSFQMPCPFCGGNRYHVE